MIFCLPQSQDQVSAYADTYTLARTHARAHAQLYAMCLKP